MLKEIRENITTVAKKYIDIFLTPAQKISQADTWQYGNSTTIASMLSTQKNIRTRQQIYNKWGTMLNDPICSSAVKLLVTAALGGHETNGQLVFIERNPNSKDKKTDDIVNEINQSVCDLINKIIYQVAFIGVGYGDAYARIYTNKDGIVDVHVNELYHPSLIQPFEQGSRTIGYAIYLGEKYFERLDISQLARLQMPRTQWVPQYGIIEKSLKIAITENNIDNLPILPAFAGGSFLYPAEDAYDKLSMSLVGLMGQRWMDSINEQIITANFNAMSVDQAERFSQSIIAMLERSKAIAEKTVAEGRPHLSKIRHLIPIFNDKQVLSLSDGMGNGRTGNISLDDILFYARLLAGALGVDLSMIGFADQLAGGLGEGGFFRTSAQIAENSRIIRTSLVDFINKIIDIHHLYKYGFVYNANNRPWQVNFYSTISALESERAKTKVDAMNSGLLLVQGMQGIKELGVDQDTMIMFLTKIMLLDEDEAKQLAKIVSASNTDIPMYSQDGNKEVENV